MHHVSANPSRPLTQRSPYFLAPAFEYAIVTLACRNPRFWERIGYELDPECLGTEEGKLALQAARLVVKETQRAPEGCIVVLQRIHRMVEDGKVRIEKAYAVAEMFEVADDAGLPSEEAAVAQMKPLLAKRLRADVTRTVIEEYGRVDATFAATVKLIDRVSRIGEGAAENRDAVRLSDVRPEPLTWLWRDRIPRAKVSILEGPPGRGKSLVSIDIAARATVGAGMPGEEPTTSGGAVLVGIEDGVADTIAPRFAAAGGDATRVACMNRGMTLTDAADITRLREAALDVQAAVIVVDPLGAMLGSRIDSHIDADVRRALAPLHVLAEETRATVLVVRHVRKDAASPLNRGLGSVGIIGTARSAMVVDSDPEDPDRRIMAPIKSNVARLARSWRFEIEDASTETYTAARIRWLEETDVTAFDLGGEDLKRGARRAEVIAWLLTRLQEPGGPHLAKVVEEEALECGFSVATLKRARLELRVVARKQPGAPFGAWCWSLPADH